MLYHDFNCQAEDEEEKIKRKKPRSLLSKGKRRNCDELGSSSEDESPKPKNLPVPAFKVKNESSISDKVQDPSSSTECDALYNKV